MGTLDSTIFVALEDWIPRHAPAADHRILGVCSRVTVSMTCSGGNRIRIGFADEDMGIL